jgi:hypothetical protein
MGIKLARRSSSSSAFEEFFCTQAVGAVFDPFAICWKKYVKMLKAPLHLS